MSGNGREEQIPGLTDLLFRRKSRRQFDLDAVATQPSVFDDPNRTKYYEPNAEWENRHGFDPKARWTWREEKKVVRRMNWIIMLWAMVMFFSLDLDRGNIPQANSDNLVKDLELPTDDYNLGNTLFRASFLIAELPSQLISKRLGSDVWVPTQMVLWSLVSASQFWMKGRTSFPVFRFSVGFFQGGLIPDTILWLSYFYKKTELPLRLGFFWVAYYFVDIVAPFVVFAILHLRGVGGKAGWPYLSLIEGIITLLIGLASYVLMPSGPTATKTRFFPKGWFSEREKVIMVNRVIRDDPTKGSMHNRQGLSLKMMWLSLTDYDVAAVYDYPLSSYLTLQLRNLGFSTLETNLLSVPAPALGLVLLLAITLLSENVNNRSFVAMAENIWSLPFLFALYVQPANVNPWIYWAIASLQQAFPYVHAIQVAWVSRNSGSVRTRAVSASVYNMTVQASSIIGANIYRANDAPRYRNGNRVLIGICVMNLSLTYCYYVWRNRQRDRQWNAMAEEEQEEYLATTKEEGSRRLDFRFAH